MPIITLTTDFGGRDGYVGAVKGVLVRGAPSDTSIVDIAHDVPRGDIAHGAWVVASACREFPDGTIHVVVVDPGVGGARRPVIVRAHHMMFVGPDNGVFAYLGKRYGRVIASRASAAATFHGRDVFAPAAIELARGMDVEQLERVELAGALPWGARPAGEGRVVHVDTYGNLITDLPPEEAGKEVMIVGRRLPVRRTYEDVAPGDVVAYIGSQRTVEIAVRDGRADRALDAPRGTRVAPAAESDPYR
jgi:hypothetical protein